jgi:hypothetical protein
MRAARGREPKISLEAAPADLAAQRRAQARALTCHAEARGSGSASDAEASAS